MAWHPQNILSATGCLQVCAVNSCEVRGPLKCSLVFHGVLLVILTHEFSLVSWPILFHLPNLSPKFTTCSCQLLEFLYFPWVRPIKNTLEVDELLQIAWCYSKKSGLSAAAQIIMISVFHMSLMFEICYPTIISTIILGRNGIYFTNLKGIYAVLAAGPKCPWMKCVLLAFHLVRSQKYRTF